MDKLNEAAIVIALIVAVVAITVITIVSGSGSLITTSLPAVAVGLAGALAGTKIPKP